MAKTTIRITHPEGGSVTYLVKLHPRLGYPTREGYEAEIARIIKMAADNGATVNVKEED